MNNYIAFLPPAPRPRNHYRRGNIMTLRARGDGSYKETDTHREDEHKTHSEGDCTRPV